MDVPDGDGETVDACRLDERGRLVGIGEAGRRVVDRAPRSIGQVAELGLDGCSASVRCGHQLRDRGDGLRVVELPGVHHHGVEPGVEPAQRLFQRVGLVQEQGDRHAGGAGNLAADGAEELDATCVEPGLMAEEAAGADDRRRALCLRGLDDGLERPAVPRLEVAERVPVRPRVREQRRQRGEGHRACRSR